MIVSKPRERCRWLVKYGMCRHGKYLWSWRWGCTSKSGVRSQLVYDSETWTLDDKTTHIITGKGINSKMVSLITGRSINDEAGREKTFGIIRWIHYTRLRWQGHILRIQSDRMVRQTVRHLYHNTTCGDMLMDATRWCSWPELRKMAGHRQQWCQRVQALKRPRIHVDLTADLLVKKHTTAPHAASTDLTSYA